ncbi:Hemolysin [Pandoraea bronchicola]|uniref:Hemolysin n=1 Tax=Pandoraea bronchicola TaxID=2508287 RepID=A0A5E5BYX5_9BURK|nr:Hemolysin [Pandoraea bronchicola]
MKKSRFTDREIMDVSLIARMTELEVENARLRKMYVEEKIKAEIVAEALAEKD